RGGLMAEMPLNRAENRLMKRRGRDLNPRRTEPPETVFEIFSVVLVPILDVFVEAKSANGLQVCERHAGTNGPIARSSTKAARNTVCSSKWGPIICTAVGIRSASMPLGTESAGCPVRFSGAVL